MINSVRTIFHIQDVPFFRIRRCARSTAADLVCEATRFMFKSTLLPRPIRLHTGEQQQDNPQQDADDEEIRPAHGGRHIILADAGLLSHHLHHGVGAVGKRIHHRIHQIDMNMGVIMGW